MLLLAAAAHAAVSAAQAAETPSARVFVTSIYDTYKGTEAKGYPALAGDRGIRQTFAPSLAALMVKDRQATARRGDVGQLDFDPFVDGQDWEIASFDIAISDETAGKATATVKFTNLDQPTTVVLHLVKLGAAWRIDDIIWQHDGKPETLRALYAHR
jgi:hypothetical protein